MNTWPQDILLAIANVDGRAELQYIYEEVRRILRKGIILGHAKWREEMKNKKISDAIKKHRDNKFFFSRGNNYVSDNQKHCHSLVIASDHSLDYNHHATDLLSSLPEAYEDLEILSNIVQEQQKMILSLQEQVQHLMKTVDLLALAKVQAEIGKEFHDHLSRLAKESNMYEHEGGKITVEVNASFAAQSSEKRGEWKEGSSFQKSKTSFQQGLDSSFQFMAKLHFSSQSSETLEKERSLALKSVAAQESSSQLSFSTTGAAVYEHGKITCDPSLKIIEKLIEQSGVDTPHELIAELRKNPFKK